MSENNTENNTSGEISVEKLEEINTAKEVIQSMIKTSKAFNMYLPNNPLHQKFFQDLKIYANNFLKKYGALKIDVLQFKLLYDGKSIYENNQIKDSLAFKFFSDGITSLTFNEGVEEHELYAFVDIIGPSIQDDIDDDVVTKLWSSDLPHIEYTLAEKFLESDSEDIGASDISDEAQHTSIEKAYSEVKPNETLPQPMMIQHSILSLTEKELEILEVAKMLEEKRKPVEEVTYILYSIMSVEKDTKLFTEFSNIMASLTKDIILMGEINYAVGLIKFLHKLSQNDTFPENHKKILIRKMRNIITDDILENLKKAISDEEITPEGLKEMIVVSGKGALAPLCNLLGDINKKEFRRVIMDALVELGQGSTEVFIPFLTDKRWFLVRNIIIILKKIGDSSVLDHIGKLYKHEELKVKNEILQYLKEAQDIKAGKYIYKFLGDENLSIRIKALKILSNTNCTDALEPMISSIESENFKEMEVSEKMALFEAIGGIGADEVIDLFKKVLLKRYWFNKSKERDSVVCAVSGLKKVNTAKAFEVLEKAHSVKKGELKEIIANAIQLFSSENSNMQSTDNLT